MKVQFVTPTNEVDEKHLNEVIGEMKKLGAPKIKCFSIADGTGDECCPKVWATLEGSHRIVAAKQLGLFPEIVEIEYDGEKRLSDYTGEDCYEWNPTMDELELAAVRAYNNGEEIEFGID